MVSERGKIMTILTAEAIAEKCEQYDGKQNRIAINRLFRLQDDSHLWPINSRFNVTDRAIRNAQKFSNEVGYYIVGLEYAYLLEQEISRIVNDEKNW